MKTRCWRSSMVEQLICNQQAAGSIPIASSAVTEGARALRRASPDEAQRGRWQEPSEGSLKRRTEDFARCLARWPGAASDTTSLGGVPERSKGTDCKSVATGFEGSNPSPSTTTTILRITAEESMHCGSSSVGRAPAFQAGRRGFEPRLPLNGQAASR